jgi:UDP-N-acetylmuramoyl-tripeptide--D-alanyl-D-alanine ligase
MEPSEVSVLEVAMNHPGEIRRLSEVLRPDIGVVMNVNPVHTESFRFIEEVADEKCSLVQGMAADATIVYNADDALVSERLKSRKIKFTYGFADGVDLRITDARMKGVQGSSAVLVTQNENISVETVLCGMGNLYNIAAAASVALIMNVPTRDMIQGIQELKPFYQRGILIHANGIDIYDDSYNSNPKALEIILKMGAESQGYKRKIVVLGDMLELGKEEIQFHQRAGEQVAANGYDILITTGPLSKWMAESAKQKGVRVYPAENSEEAAEQAIKLVEKGDLVIAKGSRGMKMEKVVERLRGRE